MVLLRREHTRNVVGDWRERGRYSGRSPDRKVWGHKVWDQILLFEFSVWRSLD